MAGIDNLRTPSTEEARAMQRLSAQKRSQNIKEAKIFKNAIAERMGYDDFNEMVDNLIKRAKENDKSFEVLRDTIGQKPKEDINIKGEINNPYKELSIDELKKLAGE